MSFYLEQRVRITRCDPNPMKVGVVTQISQGPFHASDPRHPHRKAKVNGYFVKDAPGIIFFDFTLEPVDDDPPLEESVCEEEEIEA